MSMGLVLRRGTVLDRYGTVTTSTKFWPGTTSRLRRSLSSSPGFARRTTFPPENAQPGTVRVLATTRSLRDALAGTRHTLALGHPVFRRSMVLLTESKTTPKEGPQWLTALFARSRRLPRTGGGT